MAHRQIIGVNHWGRLMLDQIAVDAQNANVVPLNQPETAELQSPTQREDNNPPMSVPLIETVQNAQPKSPLDSQISALQQLKPNPNEEDSEDEQLQQIPVIEDAEFETEGKKSRLVNRLERDCCDLEKCILADFDGNSWIRIYELSQRIISKCGDAKAQREAKILELKSKTSGFDVFLSHSWGKKKSVHDFVCKVAIELYIRHGIVCFVDEFHANNDLRSAIRKHLSACKVLVAFIDTQYNKKVAKAWSEKPEGKGFNRYCSLEFDQACRDLGTDQILLLTLEESMNNETNWCERLSREVRGKRFVKMNDWNDHLKFKENSDEIAREIKRIL